MTQRTFDILRFALLGAGILWGGMTFLAYLGVPVHQYVYMTPSEASAVSDPCGGGTALATLLCTGTASLTTFFSAIFAMGSPFLAYVTVSFLLFLGVILWSGYSTGHFEKTLRCRPIILVALFIGAVWLLGTTLSLGTLYNRLTPDNQKVADLSGQKILAPFSRFYEPTTEVYGTGNPQALAELQNNYQTLLNSGCLIPLTNDMGLEVMTQRGSRVYDLSFVCSQMSLFGRAGLQIILMLWFLFTLLALGRFLLSAVIRIKPVQPLLFLCLSFGMGALALIAILWSMSIASLLTPAIVRTLFIGLPFILYPWSLAWIKESYGKTFDVEFSFSKIHLLLVWLLVTYLALNFLNVVRPFPIGWDDLGSYLNRPRLLSSYGSFIPSMSQFQWEYLTSLGFLLFGYDSTIGATMAMQINWSAGLLSVLIVYTFGRLYLGQSAGVLAAMLYYFLPMTGHFSFADMKIDNAVFFMSTLAILTMCVALFPHRRGHETVAHSDLRFFLLIGLFAGLAIAFKVTAILSVFIVGAMLFGTLGGGVLPFLAASFIGFGVLAHMGPLNVHEIFARALVEIPLTTRTFALIMYGIGLGILVLHWSRSPAKAQQVSRPLGWFIVGLVIAVGPWGIHNMMINNVISPSAMLGARDLTAPQVFYEQADTVAESHLPASIPVRTLPPELKLDPENVACKTSAKVEELDRYWGFGTGLSHYVFLPWRQVMNLDAFGYYVTLAPALLLFPLLLLVPAFWDARRKIPHRIFAGVALTVVSLPLVHALLSGLFGIEVLQSLGDTGGKIFLLAYGILLFLSPLGGLFWRYEWRWLGYLYAGTGICIIQWMFVANGVIWYGLGMFLGLALALEALIVASPDKQNRWLFSILIALSIIVCLLNRLWQFDTQKNIFEYSLGKISTSALREVTIPEYDDIRESVVSRHDSMPETPYTYRIGTFISYFIPRNREVFPLADHQLGFFNCINQERDHVLTLKRLKALGFNGIIFDTNTQTIEKDPNGSLHQKVNAFSEFVNDPKVALQIKIYNPGNGIAYILLP